jgi:hypothetical protein
VVIVMVTVKYLVIRGGSGTLKVIEMKNVLIVKDLVLVVIMVVMVKGGCSRCDGDDVSCGECSSSGICRMSELSKTKCDGDGTTDCYECT